MRRLTVYQMLSLLSEVNGCPSLALPSDRFVVVLRKNKKDGPHRAE